MIDPMPDLLGAERWQVNRGQRGHELVARLPDQVGPRLAGPVGRRTKGLNIRRHGFNIGRDGAS